MKKTILTTLAIVLISSVSFASEKQGISETNNLELITYKVNPFCLAIVKGDIEMVEKMIELGTDVNEKSKDMTPLMYAARYNKVDIIKLLVKNGAKLKTKNNKGYNALKIAKISNAKEAMTVLEELLS